MLSGLVASGRLVPQTALDRWDIWLGVVCFGGVSLEHTGERW
jgi:hypothetical protein